MGSDCTQVLHANHEVVAFGSRDLDIADYDAVAVAMSRVRPDVVVNCAAYTNVDACETHRKSAWNVNVKGPENLALNVKKCGGFLIHISTDYVFKGDRRVPEPYVEDDLPDPRSFYGKTKLKAEEVVRQATERHIIVRTAWLYGIKGNNFLKTMMKLTLRDPRREIKVVNDQFGSPTWSYGLALQIDRLIKRGGQGTYHATSEGFCTWYELAISFLDRMKIPHRLTPCSTDVYAAGFSGKNPTTAPRPKNSILENKRLKERDINIMPHWERALDQFVFKFRKALMRETKESPL